MPWNPFKRNDDASAKPTPDAPQQPANEEAPKGVLGRFKSAMRKTVTMLNTDIRDLVKDGRVVDDEFLDELYMACLLYTSPSPRD